MRFTAQSLMLLKASTIGAQSLLNATGAYPELSDFRQLLLNSPNDALGLLTNFTLGSQLQTILIPNNDAFDSYRQTTRSNISSLSSSDLGNIVNYHSLQGSLSSSDLQTPGGLVSNTALTAQPYSNREVLPNGGKLAQVVYIVSTNTTSGPKIKARQASGLNSVDIKSGEGRQITIEPTTGRWSGGNFYIVDGRTMFDRIQRSRFLTLPVNQTDTMMAQGLTSFVVGLNRTNVTDGTNAAKGLTCVCPNDGAFAAMGNLSTSTGNLTDGPASLLATLTRHGLTGSFYTTNFTDGDLIHSQNGYPILVTRRNGSIFLNDAQIVGTDFIANTGCVHALDRIMGFLNVTTNVTTPANDPVYSNTSNIPSPTPIVSSSTGGGAIPTSTNIISLSTAVKTSTGIACGLASCSASSTPTSTGSTAAATSAGTSAAVVYSPQYLLDWVGAIGLVSWTWLLLR